jgi:hypothetical protein
MYIFIVWRLSILSKLDSNNPYRIWAELYFLNLNYFIILDTSPILALQTPVQELIWKLIVFIFWVHLVRGPPSDSAKLWR